MAIGRHELNYHEIVAHDHRAIVAHDHRVIVAIDYLSPDQTACIFRQNSSLKTYVFSLLL